jgi:hypothetical protein
VTAVSRLRRFLHIERSRTDRPAADAEPAAATAGRFGTVERPGARPQAPRSSGAELDRFGPEPDPAIELVETAAGDQPFTRCVRCGRDHGVFATECSGCGASLDTEAQREFNERLWQRRREEAARDAVHEAELRALRIREGDELASGRRAMGEALAREVGERERRRLDGELGGGGAFGWDAAARLLRRLLRGAGG